jgi:hypothetical protein
MRVYRASFVAGFAAGFVAGARSGKETYDQIVKYAKTAFEHPAVQQARGSVQTQATGLAQKVGGQLADRMPSAAHSVTDHIPGMRRTDNGNKGSSTGTSSVGASSGTTQAGGTTASSGTTSGAGIRRPGSHPAD